jgi:hypothetical protein
VARVGHYYQAATGVPPEGYHRCVVRAAKFFPNCLIEIPHERDLFQGAKVQVHERPEFLTD